MYDEGSEGAASSEAVSAGSCVARNPLQFVTICYN